jgi:hypothetical protein
MPTHVCPRIDEPRSSLAPTYIVGAFFSVVLAFIAIFVGIELSVTTASSDAAAAVENVNRAGKADRLPMFSAFGRNIANPPKGVWALDQELFDGCEALASSLAHSPLAQMAGRCLS